MKSIRLNADFWNKKYLNNEDKWGIDVPHPAFINISKKLKGKQNILIPGCGKSPLVKYLNHENHNVFPLDISDIAISFIKKQIPTSKHSNILNKNFFTLDSKYHNYFDSIIEYTFYCAFNPCLRKDYAKNCHKLLKKKGKLIAIFIPLQLNEDLSGPPFHVDIEKDLDKYFKKYFNIKTINYNLDSVPQRKDNEVLIEMINK